MGVAMVNKPENIPTDSSISRRNFLTKIWLGLGSIALLQLLTGTVVFFLSGRRRTSVKTSHVLDVGLTDDFALGSVTLIGRGQLYLVRLDNGGFLAISRICTHLGCAVPWVEERKQFECPCHASVFDMTGNVLKAPAPRALDLYPLTIERDLIKIDLNNPVRRSEFTSEQIVFPEERG